MKTARMEIHDIAVSFEKARVRPKEKTPRLTSKKIKGGELELFARVLSGLLEGGVPILKALEGLERIAPGHGFKSMLSEVEQSIRHGAAFSEALKRTGRIPVFFHQAVYGGEVSGRISGVLDELSKYMRKEQALKRSIRDALVYPCFIVAVGFMTMGVLLCVVLPKLQSVYAGFGSELPVITSLVLGLSKAFLPFTAFFLPLAGFAAASWKKNGSTRPFYQTPFLGDFFQRFARVRFSRLLSLLLESGTPVLEALEVVKNAFSEEFLRRDIACIKESLSKGGGFSDSLENIGWMDPLSCMLVVSGEDTGRLAASFFQIARDTESGLEERLHLVVKLLEPALILLVGACVGFIVIGTMLPLLDMSGLVQ